jgi:hypothetical protein
VRRPARSPCALADEAIAAEAAPRGASVDPDELARLMDESLGFFEHQPVQRKAAGDGGDRPALATGRTSIIQIYSGTPGSVLIGKGEVHGAQVGQYVRVDGQEGVPIIGQVIRVFPTRARVQFGVPDHVLKGERHGTFTSSGPVTTNAAYLAALKARRAARKAAHDDREDRDGGQPAEPHGARRDAEVRVTDTAALKSGDQASVTVSYTVAGEAHELTVEVPIQDWRGRASSAVRASLRDAGLAGPPAAAVSELMRAIGQAMARVARDRGH